MTNAVNIEALEQMLTGEDRLQIAGWCASAIQTHPSEEAMAEARALISKEDVHAAIAQRVRHRFAESTLPDRFDDLLAQNLGLMLRAQDAEQQARARQEHLEVAIRELRDCDIQIGIERSGRKRQAKVIRELRGKLATWDVNGATLCAWCLAVGVILGVAAGYLAAKGMR